MKKEITDLKNLLIAAAREAGEYMKGESVTTHSDKSNAKDFVTVADIKSQDIIRNQILAAVPDATVLSEEDEETARQAMYASDFSGFILDPIDGTYNFRRGLKESAISIGYIVDGEPVLGIIYDPYREELFVTEKGKGAYMNDQKLQLAPRENLEGASVATSNSYDDEAMARNLKRHLAIYEQSGIMPWTSCPGSGVLIMAWVAMGRIDAYHHNGLKPWDNAAAFLLVREAGGVVHDLKGEEAVFTGHATLMGNTAIVSQLEALFVKLDPLLSE
jgi:myo-inositol-1(or 4)-monophosphatase